MALKYLYAPSGYKGGTSTGTAYGVLPNDSSADFDYFIRSTFATRTNKDGLLETYQTFGNNLVINGDFASGSNWSAASGITISGGKANFDNSPNGNGLQQNNILTTGKEYEVTFTVSDYEKGSVRVRYPFIAPSVSSNGVHTVIGTAVYSSGSDDLRFQVTGETTLKIDNVSVKEAQLHVPRIDYSDGGCPSLLLERYRTNICKFSEDANNWAKNPSVSAVTIRLNDEVAPDGKKSSDVISVLTEFDGVYTQGVTIIPSTTYSCSAYVKHVSGSSKIKFGISSNFHPGASSKLVSFDLSDGSIITNNLAGVGEFKSVYVGNGWYRLIVENIIVPSNAGGTSHIRVYSYESAFTEFAVWGGQIEEGHYASSYIPNLWDSTTTRGNDRGNKAGNFEFNSAEGVLEARFKAFSLISGAPTSRITLGGATDNNRISIGYGFSNGAVKPYTSIVHEGTEPDRGYTITMPSSFNIFEYNTYKFKFEAGNNQLKINGELIPLKEEIANLDFLLGEQLSNVSLNYYDGSTSNVFYGGIKHIKVYDSITDF